MTALFQRVISLREKGIKESSFDGFGLRPGLSDMKGFRSRLTQFLNRFTAKDLLTELTSFSLPAGRNHAGDDQWVFLAFDADAGKLTAKKLVVHASKETGVPLSPGTLSQSTSMAFDDPHFYEINDPFKQSRLDEQVLLKFKNRRKIKAELLSAKPLLVGETSCATCHKFNKIRFNFHNLSKFEDRLPTISEVLKHDVSLDLQWISENL